MEPMTLGSPSNSPAGNHYLPSFLMGDTNHSPLPGSGSTLSPIPNINSKTPQLKSTSPPEFNKLVSQKTLFGYQQLPANSSFNNTSLKTQHNVSVYGPPTQGLFDSLRHENNAFSTPTKCSIKENNPASYRIRNSYQNHNSYLLDNSTVESPTNSPISSCTARKTLSFWVTVFGFPSNATSIILDHFSQCGTIVDKLFPSQNGNWVHLKYASALECNKALNSNQKVICSNIMIGVTNCQDLEIIEDGGIADSSMIRPLSQLSYRSAKHDSAVVSNPQMPQKSSGIVNKAMDLIFGW